jgi:hypothetical protein
MLKNGSKYNGQVKEDTKWDTHTLMCDQNPVSTQIVDGHVTKMVGSNLWSIVNFSQLQLSLVTISILEIDGPINDWSNWKPLSHIEGISIKTVGDIPTFISQNWLRDVQGDENNFVLKWSGFTDGNIYPHTTADSYSTVVSPDYNPHDTYVAWSVNVHNGFRYMNNLSAENNHFAVVRIAGIWWHATGSELGSRIDNELTFTCALNQSATASAKSNIYQISSPQFHADIKSWNPRYIETFANTNFRVPFDFDDYRAGNNVEFKVDFDDPIFYNTHVLHSNRISLNFSPDVPDDDKTWDKVLFATDAAVTQLGIDVRFYKCDETIRDIDCLWEGEGFTLQVGDKTYELYDDMFAGYKTIVAASRHYEGGTFNKGETRIFTYARTGGAITRFMDYYAESIAYSMDTNNNLYVATAFYALEDDEDSFVEVYKKTAGQPNSWEKIHTINYTTLEAVDSQDFCPGQVKFDPKEPLKLHILSHCGFKGNKKPRDKIYTQIIDASGIIQGHGNVVPFEISQD